MRKTLLDSPPLPALLKRGRRASGLDEGRTSPLEAGRVSVYRAFVDTHDGIEEFESIGLFALERVAAYDGAEAAAIADGTHLFKEGLIGGGGTARKDDDAATIEGALYDIMHAVGQGRDGNFVLLIDFLRLGQFDLCARSEEHTSELQSQSNLVCRLLL